MTTIVLLPGMDGSGSLFADFISAIAAKTVIVSYPPDVPLNYDELAAFVQRTLPANEPFILVGESFSGPIALMLAASQPAFLRAVVLVCSFAKSPAPTLPAALRRFVTSIPFWRAPVAWGAALLLGRFDSERLRTLMIAATRAVSASVWRARLEAVLGVDVTQRLREIQVPLLYLRASDDRVVSRSAAELVVRSCSNARITEIEGPHFLLQTKPQEAAAAVRQFAQESAIAL